MITVLVVDDEPLIRWAVREGLESVGYGVIEAGSAREALERLVDARPRPSVALLDLRLPDSDDLSLLRRVRAAAPGIRVILMTAYGTVEMLDEAAREGAIATVAKPFDLSRIVGAVQAAVPAA